jgi:GNAT superfamily N-acetyltransferase
MPFRSTSTSLSPPAAPEAPAQLPARILDWVALIDRLQATDRETLRSHFLALDEDDRRLRFGVAVGDSHIDRYVDGIDFVADNVYGVRGRGAGWLGIGHLSLGKDTAELGLSVMPDGRGRGLGAAIFRYAVVQASRRGASRLYMHCLASNRAIISIARSAAMSIESSGGESDAYLVVPDHAQLVNRLIGGPASLQSAVL